MSKEKLLIHYIIKSFIILKYGKKKLSLLIRLKSGSTVEMSLSKRLHFNKDELTRNFKNIKTFKDACDVLNYDYTAVNNTIRDIAVFSRASAAAFKLNIVRRSLNLGHELPLINYSDFVIYYPDNPFITESSIYYNSDEIEIIGKFKYKGEEYCVLNKDVTYNGTFGLALLLV